MAEKTDETTALLEELYADASARGRRDEPLIVKLAAAIERAKPQAKPEKPEPAHTQTNNKT